MAGRPRGWRTAAGQPVKNDDLWRQIDALNQTHNIEWRWVKGHASDPGNERADRLSNKVFEVANGHGFVAAT